MSMTDSKQKSFAQSLIAPAVVAAIISGAIALFQDSSVSPVEAQAIVHQVQQDEQGRERLEYDVRLALYQEVDKALAAHDQARQQRLQALQFLIGSYGAAQVQEPDYFSDLLTLISSARDVSTDTREAAASQASTIRRQAEAAAIPQTGQNSSLRVDVFYCEHANRVGEAERLNAQLRRAGYNVSMSRLSDAANTRIGYHAEGTQLRREAGEEANLASVRSLESLLRGEYQERLTVASVNYRPTPGYVSVFLC